MAAAGSGVRLGGGTPKALRRLAGRPLVVHAAERLLAGGVDRLVVVAAADQQVALAKALAGQLPDGSWQVAVGGAERQDSVRCGLAVLLADPATRDCRVVLVHDAARPLVSPDVVARVIAAVRAGAVAVTPVVPVVDTIRRVEGGGVVERDQLRAVQTPQGFATAVLAQAHEQALAAGLVATDDVTLCEQAGHPVTLVAGSRQAFKITEPVDLVLAEALLHQAAAADPGCETLAP